MHYTVSTACCHQWAGMTDIQSFNGASVYSPVILHTGRLCCAKLPYYQMTILCSDTQHVSLKIKFHL